MHAAAEAEQIRQRQQPAIVGRPSAAAFPVENQPQPQTREQDGVAVHLGFGGIVPLGVGKCQRQRGHGPTGEDADVAGVAQRLQGLAAQRAPPERDGR